MKCLFFSSFTTSEKRNLSSSAVSTVSFRPAWRSNLASIATNIAHRTIPTSIRINPRNAGEAVSINEYVSPTPFSATSFGEMTRANAVPSLAMASWSPMAKAMFPSLNHLAIDLVTATPAISLPRPKNIHPT